MADILAEWPSVVADFQQIYGVTVTPAFLRTVPWLWMRTCLFGLLSTECRVQRLLRPIKQPTIPGK